MKYQVTLFDKSGKYRPVSCIVEADRIDLTDKLAKKAIIAKGTQKICAKRYWTKNDILRYNYLTVKIREVTDND